MDTYVLSAVDDHIVPWISGYKTTQLLGGRNRFVLSNSGHIAGIVNPPSPKSKHWVYEDNLPADPQEWKEGATSTEHLVGGLVHLDRRPRRSHGTPPKLGSKEHPPIEAAPGSECATALTSPFSSPHSPDLTPPATAGGHSTDHKDPHD